MYLKSINLINTGPIQNFTLQLPIRDGIPKPILLVGKNGTGKSTVISFIVNSLVALRQKVFENPEVQKNRVFRLRSPLGVNSGSDFFFAKIEFEKECKFIEWQFIKEKGLLQNTHLMSVLDPRWNTIHPKTTSDFYAEFGELEDQHALESELHNTCLLYFPADRFEPPDWLNQNSLSTDLQMPDYSREAGTTPRRLLLKNRLKSTLEWLASLIFDVLLHDQEAVVAVEVGKEIPERMKKARPGKSLLTFVLIQNILKIILCKDNDENLKFNVGHRNSRIISLEFFRNEIRVGKIEDLMSLSAGESALFCMFASIVRDADLANQDFLTSNDIAGIVVVDEIDLHLHHNLQYKVLPRLLALFPKIQFILSVHAPAVVLGLANQFGGENFEIREMPTGIAIAPERYTEFLDAFNAFAATQKFESELLQKIQTSNTPVILFEGKTDAKLFEIAWEKIYSGIPNPYHLIPCGIEPDINQRNGGAEPLRRGLEFISALSDTPIIAVFDNDRSGNEQFKGLSTKVFKAGVDDLHKVHANKKIHAILLPVPENRRDFFHQSKIIYRYLSVEHYFPDSLIEQHNLKGEPVAPGSAVYEIDGSGSLKVSFAENALNFDESEFANFAIVFDRIKALLT